MTLRPKVRMIAKSFGSEGWRSLEKVGYFLEISRRCFGHTWRKWEVRMRSRGHQKQGRITEQLAMLDKKRCNPHGMRGYIVGTFKLGWKCNDWLLVRDKVRNIAKYI